MGIIGYMNICIILLPNICVCTALYEGAIAKNIAYLAPLNQSKKKKKNAGGILAFLRSHTTFWKRPWHGHPHLMSCTGLKLEVCLLSLHFNIISVKKGWPYQVELGDRRPVHEARMDGGPDWFRVQGVILNVSETLRYSCLKMLC